MPTSLAISSFATGFSTGGWRRLLLRLSLGLLLMAGGAGPASAQSASEYEIKAAFLLNFAKYVEWPPRALAGPGAPLRVCLLGENPFDGTLESLIEAQPAGGRPLSLLRVDSAAQAADSCHIVFIKHDRAARVRRELAQLQGSPVLTVGESADFTDQGGIVGFRIEQGRVRLTINLAAAKRAQLKISSRLLALATVVE